jgi:hypothetical protein
MFSGPSWTNVHERHAHCAGAAGGAAAAAADKAAADASIDAAEEFIARVWLDP